MTICLILLLIGSILLLFEAFASKLLDFKMINELILIMCWVFIWKAVEMYFFEKRIMKMDKIKLMQLYLAEY
jgi:hypothetical protein